MNTTLLTPEALLDIQTISPEPRFMTVPDAARYMNISVRKIEYIIHRGDIPVFRPMGRVDGAERTKRLIEIGVLDHWIADHTDREPARKQKVKARKKEASKAAAV